MTVNVGFVIAAGGTGWIGGVNYYANLLSAIAALPDRRIATTIFVPPDADAALLARFPADRVVRTDLFVRRSLPRLAGRALERAIGRNPLVERLMRRAGVQVMSHVAPFGTRSPVRTIGWIPDFQEDHLPDFFSPEEIARRTASHRRYADCSTRIVLSSEDARADLARLFPGAVGKARVLRFVSGLGGEAGTAASELRARYALPQHFFHVPNQLWIHKNHAVIVAALGILKSRGIDATVISTGAAEDYRHPDFPARFRGSVAAAGVADRFRIAGLVPYADVAGLLRHATAIINPSLFEGWSTTVEEAKSLGKRIILSDIPVHREQAPARGRYFPPHDGEALAGLMADMLASHDPEAEANALRDAAEALPARFRDFAETYQAIALDAAEASVRAATP